MNLLRQICRLQAMLQLLPALEGGDQTLIGGQAVLEGVMMRSPHAWAIAVRKASGEIVSHSEPLDRPSDRRPWLGWPLIRGVAMLGQAMSLGVRALRFSANVALDEALPQEKNDEKEKKKPEISGWMMTVNLILSLAFFIFLYKFVPLVATTKLAAMVPSFRSQIAFNLVDGAIRIALFLLFIWGISLWADIRRVYQYHGAEHKTVFNFESGDPLSIAAAQKFSTYHPRCGTSFLMTVMLIAILVFTLIPVTTFWARFAVRAALLPLIAGISYEIIRFAARHRGSLFALLTQPGLWLQRVTTQPPEDGMVECAICALDQSMALERQRGGELVVA
ncbi:MAG TPA: DUF1385 domain-containing protein [Terriglobales bacterium]|nr:DUF1385 domain-containing protein [Terriglobales bacterium]